jgi:ribose transport system ATP-binding protein
MSGDLLKVQRLTKNYSVTVLDGVEFEIRSGEIHGLLGANGAGKSTLCRIIAGLVDPTSGTMTLGGERYCPSNKQAAEACGVQIVQQELNLIPTLSVAENILLGRMPATLGVIHRRRMHQLARIALDRFELHEIATDTITGSLGVGHQQMIEIAAALDRDCRLLILDEPTASLSSGETKKLFAWLEKLRRQGVGIIYVSHRLDEVAQLTDRVTILRDGKFVCTQETSELSTEDMVNLMTGDAENTSGAAEYQSHAIDAVAFRAVGFSRGNVVRDVSFEVRAGERFGIAGLVGAGRTELLRLIFGADRADGGEVLLGDDQLPKRFQHPSQAVAAGLAMVTEDRKHDGLLLPQSIRVNTSLAALRSRFSSSGVVKASAERQAAIDMCDVLETRCTSVEQSAATLSGGNQQKVVVAKWLTRDARVFFFDEPTRGIDVASRRRIYRLFENLAADGKAIILVSSNLDELMENCDRIAVMSVGRLVEIFSRQNWSEDAIMQAAFAGQLTRTS